MNSKNQSSIHRREFIKLLSLASLAYLDNVLPGKSRCFDNKLNNGDISNIIILVFDALSAKHMSAFGYPRQTTPNISNFAKQANVYHNHYAGGNFTSPGTASLLTGVYPWSHRAFNLQSTVSNHFTNSNVFSYFSPSHHISTYTHNALVEILLHQFHNHIDDFYPLNTLTLLGEIYSDNIFPADFPVAFWSERIIRGIESAIPSSIIFSKIGLEIMLRNYRELSMSMEIDYPQGIPYNYNGMNYILEMAIDWIMEQIVSLPQPYLTYYHLYPPHHPYLPRADFINLFNDGWKPLKKPINSLINAEPYTEINKYRQQYDEYIAFVDSEFGRLMSYMKSNHILDNSILVLTSDHGELFERGIWGHVTPTLYEDLIRIPLIISMPGQQISQEIYSATSCIDLLPTLESVFGHDISGINEGRILPGFKSNTSSEDRSIYVVEAKYNNKYGHLTNGTVAIIKGRYKLIHYLGYKDELPQELYDLENDPEELENLYLDKRSVSKEMEFELLDQLNKVNQQY